LNFHTLYQFVCHQDFILRVIHHNHKEWTTTMSTPPGTPHQDNQSAQTPWNVFPAFAIFPLAGMGFDNQ
jgi:hypothetical protein